MLNPFRVISFLFIEWFHLKQLVSWMFVSQFNPTSLKEFTQRMARFANGRIVLIKHFTIIENDANVGDEIIARFIAAKRWWEREKERKWDGKGELELWWRKMISIALLTAYPGDVFWLWRDPSVVWLFFCKWETVWCWLAIRMAMPPRATETTTNRKLLGSVRPI